MSRVTPSVFVRKAAIAMFAAALSSTTALAAGSPQSAQAIADWAHEGAAQDQKAAEKARETARRDQARVDSFDRDMAQGAADLHSNAVKGAGPAMRPDLKSKLEGGKTAAESADTFADMYKRANDHLDDREKAERSSAEADKAEQRAKDSQAVAAGADRILKEQQAKEKEQKARELERIKADDAQKAKAAKDREEAAAKQRAAAALKPAAPVSRTDGVGGGRMDRGMNDRPRVDHDRGRVERAARTA